MTDQPDIASRALRTHPVTHALRYLALMADFVRDLGVENRSREMIEMANHADRVGAAAGALWPGVHALADQSSWGPVSDGKEGST